MSNFSPKLEDSTDEQLMRMVNELDFRVVPLASDELTRRSIRELNQTIKEMDKSSSKYSQVILNLTWIMLLVALIQIATTLFIPIDTKIYIKFIAVLIILFAVIMFAKNLSKKQ